MGDAIPKRTRQGVIMDRKLFIPESIAKTLEDAELLAPAWSKVVMPCPGGFMCFEVPPPPDVWEFSR